MSTEHWILSTLGLYSSLTGIAAAVVIIVVLSSLNTSENKFWKTFSHILPHAFVTVWLLGFAVYDAGMYHDNPWSLATNAPLAVLHAFGMFLLDSDISCIQDSAHKSTAFMAFFSLAHFLAALVSMVFVIKHFGFNIMAAIKLFLVSHTGRGKRKLFIFWGMNDATYYLAKSINSTRDQHGLYNTVIVRTNDGDDQDNARNGMERLFNFLSLNNNDLERLNQLHCLTTNTFTNLATLSVPSDNNILREMELQSLCRLINKKSTSEVHLFFLSNQPEANIQAVANMRHDSTLQHFIEDPSHKVKFYCRARYNSVHRVIEDYRMQQRMQAKVVDTAHISVEAIKESDSLQPVNYVTVEPDATVSSTFHALIVDFNEVGLDALRFLYEFGAFVKTGSTPDPKRSPFRCDVVSKQGFLAEPLTGITFHHTDSQSTLFHKKLEQWVTTLNYVIIAGDDDEANISLAVNTFRTAIRLRQDMSQFVIVVRIQHDKGGYISRIVEHYNRLWTNEHPDWPAPFVTFGAEETVYTYDLIINERREKDARRFEEEYNKTYNQQPRKYRTDTYSGIMNKRRTEQQNIANSLHKTTKRLLALRSLGEDQYALLPHMRITRQPGTTVYNIQQSVPHIITVLNTLAQTEHLRWNASHQIMGYTTTDDIDARDEARLIHGCIKPWQQLTEAYRSSDYNVVDLSLNINAPVPKGLNTQTRITEN